MRTNDEMLHRLEKMLREVLEARFRGGDTARIARAQGYVDGYMGALLDAGLATKQQLLTIVSAQRALVQGPATREIEIDELDRAAA